MFEANLVHDDCLLAMTGIGDKSVDLILCDLPYGTTKCKWDVIIPFAPLWSAYKRIIKPGGAIVLFGQEPFSSHLRLSNLQDYRYDWIWQKDKAANFLFGNKQPLKVHELISVFYTSQPTYNPQKTVNPAGPSKRHLGKNPSKISKNVRDVMGPSWKPTQMDVTANYHGKDYESDKLLPKSIQYFAREQRGKVHPTQKPVALLEYLIKTYSNEGDLILDNAMGSGTAGVACKNTNRRFIGIEKDETFYNMAKTRIEGA